MSKRSRSSSSSDSDQPRKRAKKEESSSSEEDFAPKFRPTASTDAPQYRPAGRREQVSSSSSDSSESSSSSEGVFTHFPLVSLCQTGGVKSLTRDQGSTRETKRTKETRRTRKTRRARARRTRKNQRKEVWFPRGQWARFVWKAWLQKAQGKTESSLPKLRVGPPPLVLRNNLMSDAKLREINFAADRQYFYLFRNKD